MSEQNLWAPWRMQYIRSLDAEPAAGAGDGCFLCAAAAGDGSAPDARRKLVLCRDERGMILLNRFPYTSGHLLVAPHEHRADLGDLSAAQRAGLMELTVLAQAIVRRAYNPHGFNIGMNLGRCAGAGLPGHLHMHVVPRWNGDTNFTSVVGGVRVIPQGIDQAYEELLDALRKETALA